LLQVAQVLEEDRGDNPGPDVTRDVMVQHGIHAVDFKGEAITFKATTAGILATLSHCIELMNQRETYWKHKFDREHAARKSAEEKFRVTLENSQLAGVPDLSQAKFAGVKNGPDYAEGPHSQLGEDEFYDAVEVALDKLEEEQEYRDRLRMMSREDRKPAVQYPVSEAKAHPLWPTIEQVGITHET
jgi:collagen type IV alpha-3-binding protein